MKHSDAIGYKWVENLSVDVAEVEAEFRAEADLYDEKVQEWDYRIPRDSTELLLRLVPKSAKILEAGCGTGLPDAHHHAAGYTRLHGCDLSAEMLEIARALGIHERLVKTDLYQPLPFDDREFDAVTCLGTLSFLADAEPTLREFCRVTNHCGIVLFSQRRDLYEERDYAGTCRRLEAEGLWRRELHSDWRLYLPNHPAYADRMTVGYFAYRVNHLRTQQKHSHEGI